VISKLRRREAFSEEPAELREPPSPKRDWRVFQDGTAELNYLLLLTLDHLGANVYPS
jgi:hypothetical protein